MESAAVRRAPNLPGAVQLGLIFALILLAAVSWAVTDDRMSGMDAGPGTDPGSFGFWVTAWVVMMAAMMFPSVAPTVLMQARIEEGKRRQGVETEAGTTAFFVCGYLLTWTAAGLLAYGLIKLGKELSPGFLAWDEAGPYVAGGVIIAAAIYQLTPLKDVCLRHCRTPMTFLLMHWRPGRGGALLMGIEHGGWCVGCCWGLMAALIALGVMSIGWMVFVAALIAIEKLLPWKNVANRGIAVTLLVLGLAVAFTPEDVPGLTLPDSPEAQAAMESMGMDDDGMSDDGAMPEKQMPEKQMPESAGGKKMPGDSMP